jgi:hypothetical protein
MAVACAVGATAMAAQAQIYKCTDDAGKTTYSDTPCVRGSKPLDMPAASPQTGKGSTVCAQLLDELHRLATASEGGKTGPSRRASALTREYEARCVGIARSQSPPK